MDVTPAPSESHRDGTIPLEQNNLSNPLSPSSISSTVNTRRDEEINSLSGSIDPSNPSRRRDASIDTTSRGKHPADSWADPESIHAPQPGNTQTRPLWKCGNTFAHPAPDMSTLGDPWEACNKINKASDKSMCEGWRDEIDKLLIFAGLFSAVVTAFTIESYKWLQPNPNDTSNLLLAQIVQTLGNPQTNPQNNTVNLPPESFDPPSWAIRVNIVWFLSLSFSLTTALVGILCMQWFREYQRYSHTELATYKMFAIRQMRHDGLNIWRVPEIMATLPLLLQSALVLFLVGLLDLLWNLQQTVASITSAFVGLVLLFLAATTILPALQFFFGLLRPPRLQIPQCPYKSPQSWLFYRIVAIIASAPSNIASVQRWVFRRRIWSLVKSTAPRALRTFYPQSLTLFHSRVREASSAFNFRYQDSFHLSNWIAYDAYWHEMRSGSFTHFSHDNHKGLLVLAKSLLPRGETYFYIYRCLGELLATWFSTAPVPKGSIDGISELIICSEPLHGYPIFPDLPLTVRSDVVELLIMQYFPPTVDVQTLHTIRNHETELFIRIINATETEGLNENNLLTSFIREYFSSGIKLHGNHVPDDVLLAGFLAVKAKIESSQGKHIPSLVVVAFRHFLDIVFSKHPPPQIENEVNPSYIQAMSETCQQVRQWCTNPYPNPNPSHVRSFASQFSFEDFSEHYKDHPRYGIVEPFLSDLLAHRYRRAGVHFTPNS